MDGTIRYSFSSERGKGVKLPYYLMKSLLEREKKELFPLRVLRDERTRGNLEFGILEVEFWKESSAFWGRFRFQKG